MSKFIESIDKSGFTLKNSKADKRDAKYDNDFIGSLTELNGEKVFTNEQDALGYIEKCEYLHLPASWRPKIEKFIPKNADDRMKFKIDETISFLYTNAVKLKSSTLKFTSKEAMCAAFYRYQLVTRGLIYKPRNNVEFEVNYYDDKNPDEGIVVKKVGLKDAERLQYEGLKRKTKDIRDEFENLTKEEVRAINKSVDICICAVDLNLRQNSHHFQQVERDISKIRRIQAACKFSPLQQSIFLPGLKMFRVAVHPFDNLRIYQRYGTLVREGKIAKTMILRYDCNPSGTAILKGVKAVLTQMEPIGVTKILRKSFEQEIDKVNVLNQKIKAEPTKYHQLSKLWGETKLTTSEQLELDNAKSICDSLAPICQAYINVYCKDGDLSGIKCFNKAVNQNQGLTTLLTDVFENHKDQVSKESKIAKVLADFLSGEKQEN